MKPGAKSHAATTPHKDPIGATQHGAVTPLQIRARAYEIYRERKGGPGDQLADWLRAERELNGAGDRSEQTPRPAHQAR